MWSNGTSNTWKRNCTDGEEAFEIAHSIERVSFIIFMVLTCFGNTLVLVATWKERSLHQPSKYFVACLAVADLLVGMILEPVQVHYYRNKLYYPSIHLCRFTVWIDTFALSASIYTLTLISFDRYLKIRKPLQYRSRMTTSKSLKIIFTICLISTAFASYAAAPHSGSNGILASGRGFCDSMEEKEVKRYYIFAAITLFFLPTVVILVMYVLIFAVVHKRRKMHQNGELGQTCNDGNQRSAFLQDLKTIRILLVVVGVFILCWGSYFIFLMLHIYKPNLIYTDYGDYYYVSSRVAIISNVISILPYFNSLCNPIIYACLDETYKNAFKNLFQRMMRGSGTRIQQLREAIELRQR